MAYRIVRNDRVMEEDIDHAGAAATRAQSEYVTDKNTVKVIDMETGRTIKIWVNGHSPR